MSKKNDVNTPLDLFRVIRFPRLYAYCKAFVILLTLLARKKEYTRGN